MKKGILFLFMAATFTSNAQSLKDLLYSGKLKMDSNTVIRKTDDLSSKIDTSQKKAPDQVKTTVTNITTDTTLKVNNAKVDNTKSNAAVTGQAVPVINQPAAVKDTAIGVVTGGTVVAATGNEV